MKKVYVVEVGAYSSRYVSAIFATRELAEQYVIANVRNSWEWTGPKNRTPGLYQWTYDSTTGSTSTLVTAPVTESVPMPDPNAMQFKEWRKAVEELTGNWNEYGDVEEYDLWDTLPVVHA